MAEAQSAADGDRRDPPPRTYEWRLRYTVGELVHYTEWCHDFAVVENLYAQYERADHASELTIERRTTVKR